MHTPARHPTALPYGVVMATGGASRLAGTTGPHWLAGPLLWLAVAAAIVIPLRAALRGACSPSRPPDWSFGDFTVPLGLAVLAIGLANQGHPGIGQAATALSWAASIALTVGVVAPVVARRPGIDAVDGTWFLAPAAALGDGLATRAITPWLSSSAQAIAEWSALVAVAAGAIAYVVVMVLAAVRIARVGLVGSARAPWWIAAGCGGLAASTVGQVAGIAPDGIPDGAFRDATLGLWILGSIALVPVLRLSIVHVCRWRSPGGTPPWPPTFSTAVYALGTLEAARWIPSQPLEDLGRVAGWATVGLWLATAALFVLTGRKSAPAR